MKRRSATILLALAAMVGMVIGAPAAASAAPPQQGELTSEVTGVDEEGNDFDGTLDITGFDLDDDGNLTVDGAVEYLDPESGELVTDTFEDVTATLSQDGQQRCDILFLDIDGIYLDVLGLVVDLDPVVLDVFAEPGPGNLLGNLLCAVTGLLDGPAQGGGILNAVENLLDRITGILGN
jgi:hypothetical protein